MMHRRVSLLWLTRFLQQKTKGLRAMGKKHSKKPKTIKDIMKKSDIKVTDPKFKKKSTDPFGFLNKNCAFDKDRQFGVDYRFQVNFKDICRTAYDNSFRSKKQRGKCEINVYPIIHGNTKLRTVPIKFDDIAYLILETSDLLKFPNISNITGPDRNHKKKQAICKIGSEEDQLDDIIKEQDQRLIMDDEIMYGKSLIGYRIKRLHFERLITCVINETFPSIYSEDNRHGVIYDYLKTEDNSKMFFNYIIGGYVILKDGFGYRIGDTLAGF